MLILKKKLQCYKRTKILKLKKDFLNEFVSIKVINSPNCRINVSLLWHKSLKLSKHASVWGSQS